MTRLWSTASSSTACAPDSPTCSPHTSPSRDIPCSVPRAYTASSVRFGVALGRLERLGELVSEYGPATGAWRHNGQVTYWTRTTPPDRRRMSWTDYCAEIDRSPQWTDEDRHGLRTP